jgi:hypothetical protein
MIEPQLITLIFIIAGALGGLFRTYISHEAKLIWPMIDPKKKRMRFGFLVSVGIGALVSYLATIGIVTFIPSEMFNNLWTTMIVGFVVGLASQTILEKLAGIKLKDPDALIIGGQLFAPFELNLPRQKMYDYIAKNIPEVERILIADGDVAGIMKVIVVPKKGMDANKVKIKVENTINQMKCPGIQVYVTLPTEKMIDLSFSVEVMDGNDPEKTKALHIPKIKEVVIKYIDSLPPGSPILKSKIITVIVSSSTLIRDVRGDRIVSNIPFESGRIPIGRFEVARAGKIETELIIRSVNEQNS